MAEGNPVGGKESECDMVIDMDRIMSVNIAEGNPVRGKERDSVSVSIREDNPGREKRRVSEND